MPVCALARNRGPLQPLKAIAGGNLLLQIFSVLTKCALEKANPMGASDHAVSKCSDRRIFRAGSALAPTASLLRPGRFLRGAVRRAANLINDCQWQSHLNSSALPTAPARRGGAQTIEKSYSPPEGGRIALSANERIAEFLDFAIQAKFAYVNKLETRNGFGINGTL